VKAKFGSEKLRSEFITHWFDPRKPFGEQFDPRRIVPAIKNEVRARPLHGSGLNPDLIFAVAILAPYNEGETLADDIH
jgi:hypothetical protein